MTSGVFSNGGHQVEVSLIGDKVRWSRSRGRSPRTAPGRAGNAGTGDAMSSSFGPVLAGGEAIVITETPAP